MIFGRFNYTTQSINAHRTGRCGNVKHKRLEYCDINIAISISLIQEGVSKFQEKIDNNRYEVKWFFAFINVSKCNENNNAI